jgi:phenylpropionate dioxygenase-like ring-hydroxylating dioxygenase large terminal subunit
MLTKEQNQLLTQTDRGTGAGELMRRYWQPVALSSDLTQDAPIPVRLLGEDLVLFRDERGAPALLARFCPHRGVDLSYGRLEDGGLRCVYHGWLFSSGGRCLEQPGEPAASTFKDRIHQTAYPCHETNGLILAYLGDGEPPLIQEMPFLHCDSESVWVTKRFHACNYLQANDVDPQHLSYLHRFFDDKLIRSDSNSYTSRDPAPDIELEPTPFGFRCYASRTAGEDERYVRITNFVMPNGQAFAGAPIVDPKVQRPQDDDGYWFHWHVPIDDVSHWKYIVGYRANGPIDKAYHDACFEGEVSEGYVNIRTAENRYLQSREEMKRATYCGVGTSFQDQDRFAAESQGPIYDRTKEHLGVTDRPVIAMRKLMFEAIEAVADGRDPLGVSRDSADDLFSELVIRAARVPKAMPVKGFWKPPEPALH